MFKNVLSGIGKSKLKLMPWKSDFLWSGLNIHNQNFDPLNRKSEEPRQS